MALYTTLIVYYTGQGNSGTILSHFYVSLAEEIGTAIAQHEDSLAIADFATCLANTGRKMAAAVPNPQEGTIVSVSRDACAQLASSSSSYANLKELLQAWHNFVQIELKKTPDQLIVDGVKVLEKAGTFVTIAACVRSSSMPISDYYFILHVLCCALPYTQITHRFNFCVLTYYNTAQVLLIRVPKALPTSLKV